jgi:hypothetical protein
MLLKELGKTVAILGISFGLIASPLAIANSSIELNKDRSAGQGVIDRPQSQSMPSRVQASSRDLTHDAGDSLVYSASSSAPEADESTSSGANISPQDLTEDVGDSTDW